MFNRGISELLQSLPDWDGLDESNVYRLLSGAWLEVIERDDLGSPPADDVPSSAELRHLATALQVDAVLRGDQQSPINRASAFVAAEALEIAKEIDGGSDGGDLEQILVALLYLIAGYDANARVAVRDFQTDPERGVAAQYAMESVRSLLSSDVVPSPPDTTDDPDELLNERIENAFMLEVGDLVGDFTRWLRDPSLSPGDEAGRLLEIADLLRLQEGDIPVAAHSTPQHFARVASAALIAAGERAARDVPVPDGDPVTFSRFLEKRCSTQPLLWPAAFEYASAALPGPSANAVIAVPTGAGKSAVADLAIQHAITKGWVLYVAPTNALVGQIRRQLRQDHPGVPVREFLGGVEYTTLPEESLAGISSAEVLVMTPEKCSLALRQSAEAFNDLALVIFDEAHTIAETGGRGVLSELVLAEVLVRAEQTAILLMSALIENPEGLAAWLSEAQGRETAVIREPWRPTRTLRAVVGIDARGTEKASGEAGERLEGMPPHRRHEKFEGRLAVLAGLRGPWSTDDPADYSLHRIGPTTPMRVSRASNGTVYIDPDSAKVRPTVEALAQLLGESGQKTMAFQPGSKHHSFRAALSMTGFGEVELGDVVESLVGLASAELGVPSLLDVALRKGAAVHTSALLAEERRASEVAFIDGESRVMFATGTLAQGLNLPATAVIVGGTKIGYSPDQSAEEELSQQRSQLLNAIGRAGRARVAMRSIALVVPNELPLLDEETVAEVVLPRAEFLKEEDASTAVTSALRPLLGRIEGDRVDADNVYPADQVVLSYLSPSEESDLASRIIGRSWGAQQLKLLDQAEALAGSIDDLGRRSLESSGGPTWSAEAARRSGVAVPVAGRVCAFLLGALSKTVPDALEGWLQLLVDGLGAIPADELSLLLRPEAFKSTVLEDLFSEDPGIAMEARSVLLETLRIWISGASLSDVGGVAHGIGKIDDPGRTERSPIPRTIRLLDSGIGFGVTRAAGLLAAAVDVGVEEGALPAPSDASHEELERLPVVLRFGASDPAALALLRAGARPRVVAHLLANLLDPPSDGEVLSEWARAQMRGLDEDFPADPETAAGRLLAQFLIARGER